MEMWPLKMALIGYGKMENAKVEVKITLKQGHQIISKIDPKDSAPKNQALIALNMGSFAWILAIHTHHVLDDLWQAAALGKTLLVGATGWYEHIPEVKKINGRRGRNQFVLCFKFSRARARARAR